MSIDIELTASVSVTCQAEDFFLCRLDVCPCGGNNPVRGKPAVLICSCCVENNVGLLYTIVVDSYLHLVNAEIPPVVRVVWFVVTVE